MISQMASKFDFKVTYNRRTPKGYSVRSPEVREIVKEEQEHNEKQHEESIGSKQARKRSVATRSSLRSSPSNQNRLSSNKTAHFSIEGDPSHK